MVQDDKYRSADICLVMQAVGQAGLLSMCVKTTISKGISLLRTLVSNFLLQNHGTETKWPIFRPENGSTAARSRSSTGPRPSLDRKLRSRSRNRPSPTQSPSRSPSRRRFFRPTTATTTATAAAAAAAAAARGHRPNRRRLSRPSRP